MRVSVTGGHEARRIASALYAEANGRFRDRLDDAIKDANRDVPKKMRASAMRFLPKRNGLAAEVARSRFRTWPIKLGITVSATHRYDIAGMDAGRVVHPLFGDRSRWYGQAVPPGWFTSVIEEQDGETYRAIVRVVESLDF